MRSTTTAQVYLDNVRVPQRNLVGVEGMGFMMQMMQFQEERLWACANAIGGLENLIQKTIDYTKERTTFGQPLINNQYIHFRFAELMTEVEALKALTYQACEQHIAGEDVTKLASMAKLKAGRLSREVADSCLQYWGGNGFMWDNPASQLYRDGRLGSIGGGADEIMLGIICKLMDILPKNRNKNKEPSMTLSASLQVLDIDGSIQLEQDGSILYLWLNRPESRNAMNLNMVNAIQQIFLSFAMTFQFVQSSSVVKVELFVRVVTSKTWRLYVLRQLMLAVYNLMWTLTAVLVPCLSKLKPHRKRLW